MTRHGLWLGVAWAAAAALCGASSARAGSEKPSGIVVFPRIEVDATQGVDTVVQLSNYRAETVGVHCFYVDALGSCGGVAGAICRTDADCPPSVRCVEPCGVIDFIVTLSPRQTLGFRAGQGLMPPVIDRPPGSIPPTQTDPFFGELKCVETDPVTDDPVARNDLFGTASIVRTAGPDAASYSAIGIESTGRNNGDGTLCLGSNASGSCTAAEYVRCPQTLHLDHFSEGATLAGAQISNELTLVPCSESVDQPQPHVTQVELLVVNEFEERRCGTFAVGCVGDIRFAGDPLFSLGVQGSLAVHTHLHSVAGAENDSGHALLGVALERHVGPTGDVHSAAHQLMSEEASVQADVVHIDSPGPSPFRRLARQKPEDALARRSAPLGRPR